MTSYRRQNHLVNQSEEYIISQNNELLILNKKLTKDNLKLTNENIILQSDLDSYETSNRRFILLEPNKGQLIENYRSLVVIHKEIRLKSEELVDPFIDFNYSRFFKTYIAILSLLLIILYLLNFISIKLIVIIILLNAVMYVLTYFFNKEDIDKICKVYNNRGKYANEKINKENTIKGIKINIKETKQSLK